MITHQHIDHLGLVEIVAAHSGAEVAAIDVVVPFIESYGADSERDDEFAGGLMRRYGIPDDMVTALRSVSASFRGWGSAARVTRPLPTASCSSCATAGSRSSTGPATAPPTPCSGTPTARILICADHLIAHISSNPLLSRPLDGSSERRKALVTYLRSLARTRELPAEILLPGHGDPITDHVALIDERFAMHRRRAEKLAA